MASNSILDNDEFKKAFKDIEGALFDKIKKVSVNDTETHKSLILSIQLLGKLHQEFEKNINTDKIKAHNERAKSLIK